MDRLLILGAGIARQTADLHAKNKLGSKPNFDTLFFSKI